MLDLLKYLMKLDMKKIYRDEDQVIYELYFNNQYIGSITIEPEYEKYFDKVVEFIKLFKW